MKPEDDWDQHWADYAESAAENPAQIMRHRLMISELRRRWPAGPDRLLDIGSGQGDFALRAKREMPEVDLVGFELSAKGVEISRRKCPGCRFHVSDLFAPSAELDVYEGWARMALCSEVLEHVDDPAAFVRASARYLQPGGLLLVTVPGGPMSAYDRHIGHRQHFTRESLAAVLEAAGFTLQRVMKAGFPFFNVYRLVVIAQGEGLKEVVAGQGTGRSLVAAWAMDIFRFLLRFTMRDFCCGWQMMAWASKR